MAGQEARHYRGHIYNTKPHDDKGNTLDGHQTEGPQMGAHQSTGPSEASPGATAAKTCYYELLAIDRQATDEE